MIDYKISSRIDDANGVRLVVRFYQGSNVMMDVTDTPPSRKKIQKLVYVRSAIVQAMTYHFPISADDAKIRAQIDADLTQVAKTVLP